VPRDVAESLVVPLIASSWGVPREHARELSALSVRTVMGLHASKLPHSLRLARGLSSYIDRLVQDSPRCVLHLNAPVQRIEPADGGELRVHTQNGSTTFDAVILACDWHNSATMCEGTSRFERWARAFRAFEDYEVRIALHRDLALMPMRREHWEATNFSFARDERPRTTVWSGKPTRSPIFRSWMRPGEPEPAGTTHVARFRHVAVTPEHPARQDAIARLQGDAGLYAVGMYTHGVDNHESALRSALSVAQKLAPDTRRVRWFSSRVSA
jgi:predicted NAD/FAD-binding protein